MMASQSVINMACKARYTLGTSNTIHVLLTQYMYYVSSIVLIHVRIVMHVFVSRIHVSIQLHVFIH